MRLTRGVSTNDAHENFALYVEYIRVKSWGLLHQITFWQDVWAIWKLECIYVKIVSTGPVIYKSLCGGLHVYHSWNSNCS
jgi:hypothetical protein